MASKITKTLAICVGISRYRSEFFPTLSGAGADMRRVSRSLVSWGILPENVRLLIDQDATRDAILHALRVWPLQQASQDTRVIFFFAGHGSRVKDPGKLPCSVLLTYDTNPADRLGTGLQMSDLVGALARVRPREAYLFIDACSLRMDIIENVLPDFDGLHIAEPCCLFCMLAAGLANSYEDAQSVAGYFTRSVLKALAELRLSAPNCATLSRTVGEDLINQGLPRPWTYLVGTHQAWPLPLFPEHVSSTRTYISEEIARHDALGVFQDAVVTSGNRPIWLWGKSGVGKTVLVQQFRSTSVHSIYCSVPYPETTTNSYEEISAHIVGEVAEQMVQLFPSGRPLFDSAERAVDYIAERLPGCTMIIDHMERLGVSVQERIVENLSRSAIDLVFVSRNPPSPKLNVEVVPCPLLSDREIEAFQSTYNGERFSLLFLKAASQGSPQRLRQLLSSNAQNAKEFIERHASQEVIRAIDAVAICGGYVDESLFRRMFNLAIDDLSQLEDMGLIQLAGDRYVPHDALLELHSELRSTISQYAGVDYWSKQVEAGPQHLWSCRMLLAAIRQVGYVPLADGTLSLAIRELARVRDWPALESTGAIMVRDCETPPPSMLYIAEELVHVARYATVDLITGTYRQLDLDPDIKARILLVESERTWWFGDFQRAAKLAQCVLKITLNPVLMASARVNIGIAHFFIGRWVASMIELRTADEAEGLDPRIRGWARMILGTIIGLRGADVKEGTRLLESSIRILEWVGDIAGLAVAWGNLGEMTWKLRDFRSALVQLQTGYDLAEAADGAALKIEIARNFIHVMLRLHGPHSEEVSEAIKRTGSLLTDDMGPTVNMQLWNTLATVAAYRGDINQLSAFIEKAKTFTEGNVEYQIYTLGNLSMLYALSGDAELSLTCMEGALKMAFDGANRLAMRQIIDDFRYLYVNDVDRMPPSLLAEVNKLWYGMSASLGEVDDQPDLQSDVYTDCGEER